MSQKVTAVNCILKSLGRKDSKEAWAKFKFQLTSKIVVAFEWPEISDLVGEWTPDVNEFRCHFVELKPNNPELSGAAVRIEAGTIGDFQIQKKKAKTGKNAVKASKVITNVLCTVRFPGETSCALLEQFKLGAKNSEMLISYDLPPQQGEIDGTRVVAHTGEVIDGRQPSLPEIEDEGTSKAPTAAEKKQQRADERARFAELRERTKKK